MPVVDAHTHAIPQLFLDAVRSEGLFGVRFHESGDVVHPDGDQYPVGPEFYDRDTRVAEMKRFGLDVSVLSPSPTLFFYDAPAGEAVEFSRRLNDSLAAWVAADPERFVALGTLPLQAPSEAAAELERAVKEGGLVGAMIGTSLPEKTPLDRAGLDDVFAVASDLDVPLLLHPNDPDVPMLDEFQLANAVGNPLDTTTAAARLILSGVLDRYPRLKLVLVHAGGFLPYQIGRLDRVVRVREEAARAVANEPTEYLRRFWIDSITHSTPALQFLAERIGPDRLVLGSDYPFDMQDPDPVGSVTSAGLDAHALGQTAQQLFGARAA